MQNYDFDMEQAVEQTPFPFYLTIPLASQYIEQKGLMITAVQLANLHHLGRGPKVSYEFNGEVYYTAEDIEDWIESEIKEIT